MCFIRRRSRHNQSPRRPTPSAQTPCKIHRVPFRSTLTFFLIPRPSTHNSSLSLSSDHIQRWSMGIGRCVMIPWILNEMEPSAKHVEYVCREARNFILSRIAVLMSSYGSFVIFREYVDMNWKKGGELGSPSCYILMIYPQARRSIPIEAVIILQPSIYIRAILRNFSAKPFYSTPSSPFQSPFDSSFILLTKNKFRKFKRGYLFMHHEVMGAGSQEKKNSGLEKFSRRGARCPGEGLFHLSTFT